MELLKDYASSDDDANGDVAAPVAQAAAPTPRPALVSARDAVVQHYLKRNHALGARRMTREEKEFHFAPYQSRRPRSTAAAASSSASTDDTANVIADKSVNNQPLFATMDDAPKTFRAQYNRAVPLEHIPTQLFQTFTGHTGGIQSLQWNPQFPLLFLSTSLDHSVRVWSMASPSGGGLVTNGASGRGECRRTLLHHTQAVRRAQWSPDGRCMLSGGLDHRAVYADVETAQTVRVFSHDATAERVTAVTIPTSSPSLALLGLDSGRMLCCDLRAASTSVNKVYDKSLGYVHDLLCLSAPSSADTRFVSSTTIRQRNASHRTLLVWDLRTTALLFDRLDEEMYARPCLRLHPMKPWFLAQSSGDYASMFSATAPYKRRKRMAAFKHHKVGASSVQCSFSATGALVATGDLGGNVVVYDTETQQVVKRLRVQRSRLDACLSAEFHPMVHSMLLAAGQDRQIYLYH